ncbi:protein RecA [Haloechinothrix alba]|uniref:Protein RecA n=1 Tax=Haloechinothrix alba TaxID=664784 RepID=A0A238X3T9_9PSEU|nr:intein-containing recombinase RecA [Haloechinothrix alba]SNR53685.1 protein RecA [Haloechinothrix alba]
MAAPDRDKALELAIAQIDKQYGKGSVMRLGEDQRASVGAIPTGAIGLDVALGLGGLPRGRVVEVFGPESSGKTTVALHAVANAQAAGGIAAFIDAEHALDPEYAKALGVDTDALLVSQPDTGEQALEIADMLIRSGALDIVVIDSVAALVPRAEIEGEMGDSHVGLQARLMSQALRKLTSALHNSGTMALFINQLREKVGVMFGCGSWYTNVTLADGTQEKLGKIVNQKMDVEVMSYDPDSGNVVPRRVVNWFNNGRADEFLHFKVDRPGGGTGRGHASLAMTRNHLIRTPGGWREAEDIRVGERVMLAQPCFLSDQQWQVILGSLMGDGNLSRPVRQDSESARFRMGHGAEQSEYLRWKLSLMENIPHSWTTNSKDAVFADFTPLAELSELREAVYFGDGKKHLSWDYLKALTPLSLAIWYMDDGCFTVRSKGAQQRTAGGSGRAEICVAAFGEGSQERLVDYLRDTYDLDVKLTRRGARQVPVLQFTTAATAQFQELIAPYVHPSMEYKLLPRLRGQFDVTHKFVDSTLQLMPARVTEITCKTDYPIMSRYDIEIEGSHNYFADGVMVHNSPETTTGGKALKFYASVRLDVRRIETLKDGGEPVGNRTRVKVVKNKCLAEGTRVFDPVTGLTHRIEDVVDERKPIHVVAAAKDGTLHTRPVVSWFDQGEQEVVGLRVAGGSTIWATPDHKVLTERGWCLAGELQRGDRVAQPRRFDGFGDGEPVAPDHARLLGYLIGDGYVGGKTPINFINVEETLIDDVKQIAAGLGCDAHPQGRISLAISHRPGERNGVLELCRQAGIHGKLAWEKSVPEWCFETDVSAEVVGNLLFGLFESDGWVSREQTGALRVGFTTTSEQLAHQIHWLLLRFGIVSAVREYDPTQKRPSVIDGRRVKGKRPTFEVRVAGMDNVTLFADSIPLWGPRGTALAQAIPDSLEGRRRRGSQAGYLSTEAMTPVLEYLDQRGLTADEAAQMIGSCAGNPRGGMRQVLGQYRIRRDRLEALADALDDEFLHDILAEDVRYAVIREVLPVKRARTFDIEVEELHTFVAEDIVVHNCAPPFKQSEFDILYGKGISREGSLIDMGVEHGILRKSGAWYTYEGDQLGQGKENARRFLSDNPDIANEVEKRIKEKMGIGASAEDGDDSAPAPVEF